MIFRQIVNDWVNASPHTSSRVSAVNVAGGHGHPQVHPAGDSQHKKAEHEGLDHLERNSGLDRGPPQRCAGAILLISFRRVYYLSYSAPSTHSTKPQPLFLL